MRPFVFLASVDTPDGERFFEVQPERLWDLRQNHGDSIAAHRSDWERLQPEERSSALQQWWQRYTENVTLLTELDIRRMLTDKGLPGEAVEAHVRRARTARANTEQWIASGESFVWESTTAVGYRNPDGQTVLRRTDLPGTQLYQRIHALRCDHCGHEYGANGCDIYHRHCPNCQDGAPGLPTSSVLE